MKEEELKMVLFLVWVIEWVMGLFIKIGNRGGGLVWRKVDLFWDILIF